MAASTLWKRWQRFAHRAAAIQAVIVLTILYWLVVTPIGLLRRRRRATLAPAWKLRTPQPASLDDARRQF